MDEAGIVYQQAVTFAHLADMYAIHARVEGMISANEERAEQGAPITYGEQWFRQAESELRAIARNLREIAEGLK